MILKDGHAGDAEILAGKGVRGCTIMTLDTDKGMNGKDQLMDAAAGNHCGILPPNGSGLTQPESRCINAECAYRLPPLPSDPMAGGDSTVSGLRTPASSNFGDRLLSSSAVRESALSRPPVALDIQNCLQSSSSHIQKLVNVPGLLLPFQRSLKEPCCKGASLDLMFGAFGRQCTTAARKGLRFNTKQLSLPVMLCSCLLFSTSKRANLEEIVHLACCTMDRLVVPVHSHHLHA